MRIVSFQLVVAMALSGCGGAQIEPIEDDDSFVLTFDARIGDQPFACGERFAGLGSSRAIAEPIDLRLYVHGVELLRESGESAPFELLADGAWQSQRVALLDFEDATGLCKGGTAETNARLVGHVAPREDYTGVKFSLGVPPDLDHLDLSTAEAPLDVPGMWWSWQAGYKYLRADLSSAENPDGFLFHLGASFCQGAPAPGYECEADNLATVSLQGDLSQPIVLDLAPLFAGVDLQQRPDLIDDLVPGCMSNADDPECAPMLGALGLPAGEQRVFRGP